MLLRYGRLRLRPVLRRARIAATSTVGASNAGDTGPPVAHPPPPEDESPPGVKIGPCSPVGSTGPGAEAAGGAPNTSSGAVASMKPSRYTTPWPFTAAARHRPCF